MMTRFNESIESTSVRGGAPLLMIVGFVLVMTACSPAGDRPDASQAPSPDIAKTHAGAAPADVASRVAVPEQAEVSATDESTEIMEAASDTIDDGLAREETATVDVSAGEEIIAVAGAGNAEAGARAFAVCRSCHTVDIGRNGLGPSLAGVVGRPAGTIEGFNYSDAMKAASIVWTPENLDMHLKDSESVVPGNRMSQLFRGGVKDDTKRADIIAYLATQ